MDKGLAPFLGWIINATGLLPKNSNGNCFLLVAVDPFFKWVKACAVPSLHSWHAADILEDIMHWWSKLRYIRMDHVSKFKGSFAHLCKVLSERH